MSTAAPVRPDIGTRKQNSSDVKPEALVGAQHQGIHWDGRPQTADSLPIGRNEAYRPYLAPRDGADGRDCADGTVKDISKPIVLPNGVSEPDFLLFLDSLRIIVGENAVVTGQAHAAENADPFSPFADPFQHVCSASVLPTTVQQLRELVKAAGSHQPPIPYWTVSRGRNLGYGGSSPVVTGSICMDLSHMNKIVEVNEEYAYCIVEPGVTFFDLYDYIREKKLDLLSTTPGIGWGSIVGNTLDRGWGYVPSGDHPNQVAGLEVVLADGDLMRTNMGAIDNGGKLFAHFKGSYGPGADQLFFQSNFGIVTKMALWLSPKPKAMYLVIVDVQEEDDLVPLVDICGALARKSMIDNRPVIGNVVRMATLDGSPRSKYWKGPGAIPDDVLRQMMKTLDTGFWNSAFCIYGDPRILDIKIEIIKEAFASIAHSRVREMKFVGEEADNGLLNPQELFNKFGIGVGINLGVPSLVAIDSCKWRGEDCGHLGFSPILRPNGREALEYYKLCKAASARYTFDFFAGLHLSGRHLCAIQMILFDRHDSKQRDLANKLFDELLVIGKGLGVSEYRAHVAWMDKIADQYDFNNGAQSRFNQKIKDALDPNGILSPGKQGVWNSRKPKGTETQNAMTSVVANASRFMAKF